MSGSEQINLNGSIYQARLHELWRHAWPREVPRQPRYPFGEIPLSEYLRHWARLQPDRPALIFYGSELTYAELDSLSDRMALLLASCGVERGDRVVVFLPNCPQFLIAFYGVLKLGAVFVPVNPLYKTHEFVHQVVDAGAQVIIALDQLMDIVRAVADGTGLRRFIVTSFADVLPAQPTLPLPRGVSGDRLACAEAIDLLPSLRALSSAALPSAPALDDIAAINYTGGTTGIPKGCIHSQRDMIYTAAAACTCITPLTPDDVSICFLPVFWIAGENLGVIFPIFSGSTCVLLARWDPVAFMAAVDHYKVTDIDGTVDAFVEVMNHPDVGRYDLRSLQRTRAVSFVKALTAEYRQRWRKLTGTTMIQATYGSTETHTMDVFTRGMQDGNFDLRSEGTFIGLPVPGTEFRICDFATRRILPLGTTGEICVRSPSLLKGYWNNPDETRASLVNGWFHTGDIGQIDIAGYLHYLGRGKEMLKVNGMSVFPTEVEGLLMRHPAVARVGVAGIADAATGQRPAAFVVLAEDWPGRISEDDLTGWCRDNMATYKVPAIHFVAVLPMTATGKVKRGELERLLPGAAAD
jgi:acyl-CoA synthetase (AMP-forming)/AMP-acid ligase II